MKTLFAALLFVFCQTLSAQNIDVKWGKDLGNSGEANQVTGKDSVGNPVYASPTLLARINKLKGKTDIYHTFLYFDKMVRTYKNVQTLNHQYASISGYSETEKKINNYFVEIDAKGNPVGTDHLISSNEFDEYKSRPGNSKYTQDFMGAVVSDNGKMIAFISQNSVHDVNKTPEKIYLTVVDENLNPVWKKELTLPTDDKVTDLSHALITNAGKLVFACGTNKTLTTGMLRKELTISYKLFEVSADNLRETSLTSGLELQPVSFAITELKSGDLMIAGNYFAPTKNYKEKSTGIFAYKVDMNTFTVTAKDLKPYKITENPDNDSYPISEVRVETEELCLSNKGELLLILRCGYGLENGMGGTYVFYLAAIGSDAKIVSESILKNNFSANTTYEELNVFGMGDKVLILANEGPTPKEHTLRAIFFDYSGKLISEKTLPLPKKEYFLVPRAATWFSDTTMRIGASPSDSYGYTPIFMYGILTIK